MDVRSMRNQVLGARIVKNLESRNMEAYYTETKEEAVKKALELMPEGCSVSWGGVQSATDSGLMEAVCQGNYCLIDRAEATTEEEKRAKLLEAFDADFYLGSANAISEDGVLVNIDGAAGRVAAYCYGPKNVLLIVGMNKVTKTVEDAVSRARNEAAPINAQRFGIDTPCVKNGTCFNCKVQDCICCQMLITRFSKIPKRIKVILVNEDLGF